MKKKIKQFFFTPLLAISAALALSLAFCVYIVLLPFALRSGATCELNEACGDLVKTISDDIEKRYQ